jgi:hypothetical protein
MVQCYDKPQFNMSAPWQRNTNSIQSFQDCQLQVSVQKSLEKRCISQVKDAPKATYLHDTHRLEIALSALQKHAAKLPSTQVVDRVNDLQQIMRLL